MLSVDVEDIIGTHVVDFEGSLKKYVTDSKGKIVEILKISDQSHDAKKVLEKTIESLDKNYGCTLKGSIIVNKVNGDFHISSHAYGEVWQLLQIQQRLIDFTHSIKHLSFGNEQDISKIKSITGGYNLAPLDGTYENTTPQRTAHILSTHTTYYMDITPTRYLISDDEEYTAHEFAYTTQTLFTHGQPAIFFKFELSPIFVNYKVTQVPFFVFFIRI
jgi:hypothetical protein